MIHKGDKIVFSRLSQSKMFAVHFIFCTIWSESDVVCGTTAAVDVNNNNVYKSHVTHHIQQQLLTNMTAVNTILGNWSFYLDYKQSFFETNSFFLLNSLSSQLKL